MTSAAQVIGVHAVIGCGVHPIRALTARPNNSSEGLREVKAIFGGARLACYFCQRETEKQGAGLEWDGLFFACNFDCAQPFSFPPPFVQSSDNTGSSPSSPPQSFGGLRGCPRSALRISRIILNRIESIVGVFFFFF